MMGLTWKLEWGDVKRRSMSDNHENGHQDVLAQLQAGKKIMQIDTKMLYYNYKEK